VDHLFNGGLFEQNGEQRVALVFAVEVEKHVLMNCGHFIRNSFVE